MSTRTIQISETMYHRLTMQAAKLHLTPEQLIERLLTPDLLSVVAMDEEFLEPVPPANSDEALAAVQRLATCFADVTLPDLEAILADPLISLANAEIDTLLS